MFYLQGSKVDIGHIPVYVFSRFLFVEALFISIENAEFKLLAMLIILSANMRLALLVFAKEK